MSCTIAEVLVLVLLVTMSFCGSEALANFTNAPRDVNITEGGPLSINCTYTNANRIFWRKGGVQIDPNDVNFDIEEVDSSTSTLELTPSAEHTVHTGEYQCVAMDGVSQFTTDFTVTVQYLANVSLNIRPFQCIDDNNMNPMNSMNPMNPYIGSVVVLECRAEGEPFPRVAWFLNEVKLRDFEHPNVTFQQNKRILNITYLSSNNSGEYYCRSENDVGSKRSKSEMFGFTAPYSTTSIKVVNANDNNVVYAPENGRAEIDCQVSPPIPAVRDVIFRKDRSNIRSDVSTGYAILVKQCNLFALRITNFTADKVGNYECTFDENTAQAQLKIGRIIPIIVPASPIVIGVGREVRLSCRTERRPESGDIDQRLIWKFQTETRPGVMNIESDLPRVRLQDDPSAISLELIILSVESGDAGTYFCVAFSPEISRTSIERRVELRVETTPTISVTPPNSTVQIGTSLSMTCILSSQRASNISWMVAGVDIKRIANSSHRFSITNDPPNQSVLLIKPIALPDLGLIQCIGQDPIHIPVTAEAEVIESTIPYLVGDGSGKTNVMVEINDSLMLNCTLRGLYDLPLTAQWFIGNRQLTNGSGFSILNVGKGASMLTKTDVSLTDEANYLCRVNVNKMSLKIIFNVSVSIPPMFTKTPPDNINGVEGARFELKCEVSGRPIPEIFWVQSVVRVSELGDPYIRDAGNGSLVFERLQRNHSGFYFCKVVGFESISDRTWLEVLQENTEFHVGTLNISETILVFTVVGLVVILILIAAVMLIAVVISCYYMRRSPQGKYTVKNDSIDGAYKRQTSLGDDSGINTGPPSNHIFDKTLQSPGSASSAYNNPYIIGPETATIPLATYRGPVPPYGGGVATNSVFSEAINSHTSTPLHGTMASTSLFGSEEQTSVTTQLPNFPRANLQLGDVMGEGEFGPVIMGVATNIVPGEERTLVAVKALILRVEEGEEEMNPEAALVDFANQMKLEFANIAVILGMCTDMEPYYVIYEYLNEGDLKKYLINSRPLDDDPPSLTAQHMRKIILQVADGMAYLFSQRIIHGDLATRNCLISSDLRVKIADLGIGHDLYNPDYYDNGSQLLPIRWMPPELLVTTDDGPTFSLHSDIWSFGVLCWEVFSYSRLPYDSFSDEEVLSMVPAGTRLRSPSKSCPPALYDIMMDCWHEIPEERPVFAKLCVAIIGCELD